MRLRLVQISSISLSSKHFIPSLDQRRLEDLGAVRPQFRVNIEHLLDDGPQIIRIGLWYALDLSSTNPLEKTLHARGLERRLQGNHLVQDAS